MSPPPGASFVGVIFTTREAVREAAVNESNNTFRLFSKTEVLNMLVLMNSVTELKIVLT